ncbi:hypothetical protein [Burkholderia vietnamiensis]|uniref:hypothetical protein n=1 Tax=Burkholderia vietnamiensis TaxID=60552 RepID=UPI00158F034C|nr:hypothetical protein [Burkholderia vietnamiensis]
MGAQHEFDIDTARAHVYSGSVETAIVRSVNTNLWAVYFPVQTGEVMLVTTRDRKPRLFRDAHLALKALREISLTSARVEMGDWSTTAGKVPAWGRADQAKLMKRTHALADAEDKFENALKAALKKAPEIPWHENPELVKAVANKVEDVSAAGAFDDARQHQPTLGEASDLLDELDFSIEDVIPADPNSFPMI